MTKYQKVFLIFSLLWFLLVLFVGFNYQCPLGDDWAYAKSVENLLGKKILKIHDYSNPSLIWQVLWGAAFSKIFGYSFATLRLSTLTIAFLGLLSFIALFRILNFNSFEALCAALSLCSVFLFVVFSFTFMTDIHFLSLYLIWLFSFCKGIKTNNHQWLFVSSIVAALAFLTRQLGLVMILAAIISIIFSADSEKRSWRSILAASLFPLLIVLGYFYWTTFLHASTLGQREAVFGAHLKLFSNLFWVLKQILKRTFIALIYMGLFIAPLVLSSSKDLFLLFKKAKSIHKILFVSLILIFVLLAWGFHIFFLNLPGYYHRFSFLKNPEVKILTTGLGVFGACFLSWSLLEIYKRFFKNSLSSIEWAFLLSAAGFFVFTGVFHRMTDRYLLVFIPVSIWLGLNFFRNHNIKIQPLLFSVLIFSLISFNSISVKRILQTQNASWLAGLSLLEEGYKPDEINWGYEWNGYFLYESSAIPLIVENKAQLPRFKDAYENILANPPARPITVSLEIIEGCNEYKRIPYKIFPGITKEVYILKCPLDQKIHGKMSLSIDSSPLDPAK